MRKYEQTVEVFAKPGCSRESSKIPNESPFLTSCHLVVLPNKFAFEEN
jgi:hypothetical protein